jgi:hypothetical protein
MRKIHVFCTIFVLMFAFSCTPKNGTVNKNKTTIAADSNENTADSVSEDKVLRETYATEILLANTLINKLEDYYSQNNKYPKPVDFIYDDLEKEIADKSGKPFYYTWLNSSYALTYELLDGTGLIYDSDTKLWGISAYLP